MASTLRLGVMSIAIFLLSIIPFLSPVDYFRPVWLLLFVLYLQATFPKQCGVSIILLFGLILDALTAGLLGQQAFALLLTVFIAVKRVQRFRLFSISQQLFGIATLSCFYQSILLIIQVVRGFPISIGYILLPIVTSVLCWPWLQSVCDHILLRKATARI